MLFSPISCIILEKPAFPWALLPAWKHDKWGTVLPKQGILHIQFPLAVVLPRPGRGAGTLIPSAQRLGWAAKQPLGNAALGALFA